MAPIKHILAAGAATAMLAIGAGVNAQEALAISKYRIQSDDCGLAGCGMPAFASEANVTAFFTADRLERAKLASSASGAGPHSRYDVWRRGYTPYHWGDKQVVYLDFDAGGLPYFPVCFTDGVLFGVFEDHVYTQAERDAIEARLEEDYKKFNITFTQHEPAVGEYSTVYMGYNDAPLDCSEGSNVELTPEGYLSILFGRAENIDFRNQSKTDTAFADASFWEFLAQYDAALGTNNLGALSGYDVTPENAAEVLSTIVVVQSANTAAHEYGHIAGLRHHDAIGAPGDGLPTSGVPDPNDFIPAFEGPQDASETPLHLMASGASVGLTLTGSTITNRFFSERSSVKLSLARTGTRVLEENFLDGRHRPKTLWLKPFYAPNTLVEGENADKPLDAEGLVISGAISETGEVDEYRFFGQKGKFVNIEMISYSDELFENPVIGAIKLSKLNWDGSKTEIATNIQTFEPFDPLIFDQELPETGVYVIEIDAPNIVYLDYTGDGVPDEYPLDETGNGDLRYGDYELAVYSVDARMGVPWHRDFYHKRHPQAVAWWKR